MTAAIRALIVDDDMLTRAGLRAILCSDDEIEVIAEAATGYDAVRLAAELAPDIVLMDIQLPDLDGIEAARRIVAQGAGSGPRVVMLTTFELDEYAFRSLQAGACGYLLKRLRAEELIEAVKGVASGGGQLAQETMRNLARRFAEREPVAKPGLRQALTKREEDVLRLIAHGRSNQEIGQQLGVSLETVRTHVKHVYWKCGVRRRAQAVIAAYENGIAGRQP